jgi:predicted Zn-ribbon and HTH transcriptional regulator
VQSLTHPCITSELNFAQGSRVRGCGRMAEAPKQMVCRNCGRRYRDPATIKSGNCPRCQGQLVAMPQLRQGLPPLRDQSRVRENGDR